MDTPSTFNPPAPLRFRQAERLRLRTLVERLFASGHSFFEWPLRAVVSPLDASSLDALFKGHVPARTGALQMLVTVPKRKRRHAVDRVLMRRRVREAWRLGRIPLREAVERHPDVRTLSVGLIYMADRNVEYRKVEKAVGRLLERIADSLAQGFPPHAEAKRKGPSR